MESKNEIEKIDAQIVETNEMPVQLAVNAELDVQITTAKRYPRSIDGFRKTALSMATLDQETASKCFYVLKKGDKLIEGPSVRMSEIVAVAYKNLRYGQSYIGETEDRKSVIGEGFCFDLENNVASRIQITRRIVDRFGKRYRDDVVETTKLAACAIAKRQAIFNVIPMMFIQDILEKSKEVAVGKASSLSSRKQKAIEHFSKYGVTQERILAAIGKPSVDDVDLKDVETLLGLSNAIRDGEIDIDAAFPSLLKDVSKSKNLSEKVAEKAKQVKDEREPGLDG